ncbi:MAG: two-component system, cell cycle response regulator, partial [Methanolobus sp.]|nr:two-component system, cell cycle response regulator [Methanolobus sp.]
MDEHKKGKVLIVDDESMNVKLLDAYLMHEYDIISAYGGVEALEKVEAHNPDIILLDLMMPDITGYEVCK